MFKSGLATLCLLSTLIVPRSAFGYLLTVGSANVVPVSGNVDDRNAHS